MHSILEGLKRAAGRRAVDFYGNTHGNVAIVFALTGALLMVAVGAGVDMGRWLHARDQTAAALDAAVLAGARAYHISNNNEAVGVAAAQQFYDQNVASRFPIVDDTISFAVNADKRGLTASGNVFIKTPFLRFAGVSQLPLLNIPEAIAEFGSGEAEISLMLDVTGSMAGQKLKDLKDAATDMVNIVLDANKDTKMALVPFSEDIRLPTTSALSKARDPNSQASFTKTTRTCLIGNFLCSDTTKTYRRTNCLVERMTGSVYTDDSPASGRYVQSKYVEHSGNANSFNPDTCAVPSNAAVQPLTNSKSVLTGKINNLGASGGTAGHLGTAWAWYTLSPSWNSLWSSENQARPYNSDKSSPNYVRKIAVLMTDGEYNTQYSSEGLSVDSNSTMTVSCPNAKNGCSSVQAKAMCKAMKQKGIEVFTIVFGQDRGAIDVMKDCASPDTQDTVYFYNATSGEQLKSAFRDIGIKMTKLYLSK